MTAGSIEAERREKFLHHVQYFDVSGRYPAPYIGFVGRPHCRFQIHSIPYDGAGFLNPETTGPRVDRDEIRVFVVGDSTMAMGADLQSTVPKRIERALRSTCSGKVNVYNFSVVSSNTEQMCSLIWSRIFDLDPDLIIVVSGGTDAFQPYTFDPRPGFPYNFFISEFLYAHYFDKNNEKSWRVGLDYDSLVADAFDFRTRLRHAVDYGSDDWEERVALSYKGSLIKIIRAAQAVQIPFFYFLEPIVVRKKDVDTSGSRFASPEALAYLARQYDRFEASLVELNSVRIPKNLHFIDASRSLDEHGKGEFYDILHYDCVGTATVAQFFVDHLVDDVQKISRRRSRRSIRERMRKTVDHLRPRDFSALRAARHSLRWR